EIPLDIQHGYCILNFYSVFAAISASVICKTCKNEVCFTKTSPRGLGFKIQLQCTGCCKMIQSRGRLRFLRPPDLTVDSSSMGHYKVNLKSDKSRFSA
ncbi:hypothetical protein X777_09738, partial [Ooceraea biroi]